ncbi:MAG: acyltransferase family protein [Candidatus Thorarchaeota archaeon]|jgi:peptidoglycan/LPS O-acetylase OafA/YrhL
MTIQEDLQPTENSQVQAAAGKISRLFFIDHLRAALVILVVLHHVAIVYGAGAPFYYVEPPFTDPLAFVVLLSFVLFNQAWFMGALYLIAGYFTPGSFERKGSGSFLKSRLVRLGIPLIIWIFVLSPISAIGYWQMPAELTGITNPLSWQAYPFLLGLGVAWFLALLLIFNFGYAAWRWLTRNRTSSSVSESSTPSYLGIGIFILALALVTYLVRSIIPIGKEVLDFPTLGYLPQYLSLFVVGIVAFRRDWFRTTPGSMGVIGFVIALLATVFLFPLATSGRLFSLAFTDPADFIFVGNGVWQSAVYALWDSIFVVGMCLAAITFFRRFFNGESRFGRFLSQQSYAVYVIHVPIVVFIGSAMKGVQLPALLKFGIAAVIAVPTCYVVAYLIRKIPGVSRVL